MREFLFEQRGEPLRRRIAERIIQQIGEWMPFISISELNISFSTDDSSLRDEQVFIRLVFRFSEDPSLASTITLTI
jgi:hypothetical protein